MSLYRISSLHQAKQLNKNKQLNKTRISKSVVWANIVIQAIFPLSIAFTPAVMAAETVGASDEKPRSASQAEQSTANAATRLASILTMMTLPNKRVPLRAAPLPMQVMKHCKSGLISLAVRKYN